MRGGATSTRPTEHSRDARRHGSAFSRCTQECGQFLFPLMLRVQSPTHAAFRLPLSFMNVTSCLFFLHPLFHHGACGPRFGLLRVCLLAVCLQQASARAQNNQTKVVCFACTRCEQLWPAWGCNDLSKLPTFAGALRPWFAPATALVVFYPECQKHVCERCWSRQRQAWHAGRRLISWLELAARPPPGALLASTTPSSNAASCLVSPCLCHAPGVPLVQRCL